MRPVGAWSPPVRSFVTAHYLPVASPLGRQESIVPDRAPSFPEPEHHSRTVCCIFAWLFAQQNTPKQFGAPLFHSSWALLPATCASYFCGCRPEPPPVSPGQGQRHLPSAVISVPRLKLLCSVHLCFNRWLHVCKDNLIIAKCSIV